MRHSDYRSKIGDQPFPIPTPFVARMKKLFIRKDILPYKFGMRNFTFTLKMILFIYFVIQTFWFFGIQYQDILNFYEKLVGK